MQFPALAFNSTELITCNWGNKAEMDPSPVCVQAGDSRKVCLLAGQKSTACPHQQGPRPHQELSGCRSRGPRKLPSHLAGCLLRL